MASSLLLVYAGGDGASADMCGQPNRRKVRLVLALPGPVIFRVSERLQSVRPMVKMGSASKFFSPKAGEVSATRVAEARCNFEIVDMSG